jgi:RNA 2',3'-cyclic 3'-phosphodiesterase
VRLFVAAYPSAEALADLAETVSSLPMAAYAREHSVNARLADPALWHLTLSFLGEVPDDLLGAAIDAVSAAAAAVPAPDPMRLSGGGTFGRGRFTTAWVGLSGGELSAAAATVRRALRRARLPYDRKPFRPHLTIARPGDRVPRPVLAESIASLDRYAGPRWTVGELCLVSSRLGPKPEHQVLHRAPLVS